MREHLLGYLLNALEEPEHAQVEKQLQQDDQLQLELKRLSGRLDPFDMSRAPEDPPQGLASRTLLMIHGPDAVTSQDMERAVVSRAEKDRRPASVADLASPSLAAPSLGSGGSGKRWSMADVIVASGVMVASALLFFPAIANSRYQAELAGCQNNLRQAGVALSEYSQQNGGYFPSIPTSGNLSVAGAYAPTLVSDQYVTNPRQLICPNSPLATESVDFRIPSREEVLQASGESLRKLQQTMGGSYGYAFGYFDQGKYHDNRNQGRDHFALMSDAPCLENATGATRHHGGRGQNVLFESGRVSCLPDCQECDSHDHLFRNDRGLIEAGCHQNDSVIGTSAATPFGFNKP